MKMEVLVQISVGSGSGVTMRRRGWGWRVMAWARTGCRVRAGLGAGAEGCTGRFLDTGFPVCGERLLRKRAHGGYLHRTAWDARWRGLLKRLGWLGWGAGRP